MAQIIRLKRSTVQGSKPTTTDLTAGELAINVYDGKVFLRKSGSEDVVQELVTNNYVGDVNVQGTISASFFEGDGSLLTGINIGRSSTVQKTFTDESTWVVTHNFNNPNPIVAVYDQNDYAIIPESLRITDSDTVTVTFDAPRSGYVVVAMGGHVVSGSIPAENVEGLTPFIQNYVHGESIFSGSAQVTMSGDVTGTAAATVIASLDGGDI